MQNKLALTWKAVIMSHKYIFAVIQVDPISKLPVYLEYGLFGSLFIVWIC